MGHKGLSRILKKEEVQVPGTLMIEEFSESHYCLPDTEDGENFGQFSEGFMDWDCLSINEEGDANGHQKFEDSCRFFKDDDHNHFKIKQEEYAFPEDDEKKLCLNLSLNYQEVLEAWSDRPLWADDNSFVSLNNAYMGEVPVMEEERRRREASVIRYREKRQNRLFSKKIRYQVRKLNADNRPRLKGRFVKAAPVDEIFK